MSTGNCCDNKPTFIDLFSGCGGLSLGLMQAGWQGIFAVEKTNDAFKTLHHNLVVGEHHQYTWPEWLPKKNMIVQELLTAHREQLASLVGKVDLIAGGPPCQGFSYAGKRNPNDPRNKLAEQYIEVVKIVKPRFLLLENVRGFNSKFEQSGNAADLPYSEIVKKRLEELGYGVDFRIIISSEWGVPQRRPRFIMVAKLGANSEEFNPFNELDGFRERFLSSKGLNPTKPTTVKQAIGDLEIEGKNLVPNTDSGIRNYFELDYAKPRKPSRFQKLMRDKMDSQAPNSLRLPKHTPIVKERFKRILATCPKGTNLSKELRETLGLKKHTLTPLDPNKPSATVTTLPDDILHYSEPRILTVRENARLQSFPDWFEFQGVYTTGGKERKNNCPRYTQVGNAVPPLLAEALGKFIYNLA